MYKRGQNTPPKPHTTPTTIPNLEPIHPQTLLTAPSPHRLHKMSSNALPIPLTRFASALSALPLDAIYAKHSELRNNIAHMQASNVQLEEYARQHDDRDCYEALVENRQVIARFEERIGALRNEVVEVRGLSWRPMEGAGKDGGEKGNGESGGGGGSAVNGREGSGEEDGVFL
ncbi:hypothetical protein BDU57DRAFT_518176 [Ampelomyces quisqualis]|uniref:Uncharacterized protein n=1 Tax=Ampelomyces quisqualis TaxID=50730 RepID=A0A6A5QHN5_AMPQU|nr:hypothetical protein BDU57DRAFT_518176 [Ampelomyces quisqualis]